MQNGNRTELHRTLAPLILASVMLPAFFAQSAIARSWEARRLGRGAVGGFEWLYGQPGGPQILLTIIMVMVAMLFAYMIWDFVRIKD